MSFSIGGSVHFPVSVRVGLGKYGHSRRLDAVWPYVLKILNISPGQPMSTTNLFVELIVIGIGAMLWLTLLTLALFGFQWLQFKVEILVALVIPLLSLIYLLGIIVDRIADSIFERIWSKQIRKTVYQESNQQNFYNDRRLVLSQQNPITERLLYAQSRTRICRGWSLNAAVITLTYVILMFSQFRFSPDFWRILIYGSFSFLTLSFICWIAWKMLKYSDYLKTQEYAEFLRSKKSTSSKN